MSIQVATDDFLQTLESTNSREIEDTQTFYELKCLRILAMPTINACTKMPSTLFPFAAQNLISLPKA